MCIYVPFFFFCARTLATGPKAGRPHPLTRDTYRPKADPPSLLLRVGWLTRTLVKTCLNPNSSRAEYCWRMILPSAAQRRAARALCSGGAVPPSRRCRFNQAPVRDQRTLNTLSNLIFKIALTHRLLARERGAGLIGRYSSILSCMSSGSSMRDQSWSVP